MSNIGEGLTVAPAAATPGRSRLAARRRKYLWAYAMVLPNLCGLLLFYIWPVFQTFYYSFTKWGYFGGVQWVGLQNYIRLLHDRELRDALVHTLEYVVITVPLSICCGLVVAVLLNQRVKGVSLYRTLYFIPVVTMPAAVAMVWGWLYNSDYGLINFALRSVGLGGPHWLTDPRIALPAVALVGIWQSIGSNMIYFLSGLQAIPSTYYESAAIDGATAVQRFFRITLPLLTPTTFFVLVISLIGAFQVFDLIYMMISPNSPVISSSETIVYLFYKQAFALNDKGYGAAIAFLLFFIIMAVTLVQMRLQKRWVHYQ
ncbi:MAG: sugar ABC transporter permease [Alicyclobacillus sp.]|nr:sugar ABC transporter permease [Alicyclobacillus sp.]